MLCQEFVPENRLKLHIHEGIVSNKYPDVPSNSVPYTQQGCWCREFSCP